MGEGGEGLVRDPVSSMVLPMSAVPFATFGCNGISEDT